MRLFFYIVCYDKPNEHVQPSMIIGNEFNKKSKLVLRQIGQISGGNMNKKIAVREVNEEIDMDRTEIRHLLEYLQGRGYIEIITIGGPLLYGHIKITEEGLEKYAEIRE